MSLLEDVFLEDEAGEAQELERVIEGDEFDERPRTPDSNNDSEKEDEAEEDKRRVDHTAKAKRVVKNPRFVLNPARLTGPRGIQIIPEHFKDFKFRGKGHEREDLDCVLKKLEHWAYRLYPKFKFDDCLKKIETLGKKRPVMVHLHKIRTDQYLSEDTVVQQDSSGDEAAPEPPEEDEFDRLLQQQIELARATPAPGSVRKELHTPVPAVNRSPLMPPKATSSPSISDDQKERMIRNRKLAEERRLARLNQLNNTTKVNGNSSIEAETEKTMDVIEERIEINEPIVDDNEDNDVAVIRKHNRSNVIDSSDDEADIVSVNESIKVDVHNFVQSGEHNPDKNNTNVIVENPETNVNIDDEIDSMEDTVTLIDSNEAKMTRENSSNDQAELESDNNYTMNKADLPKDKTLPDSDTNLDKPELTADKNENVDKELIKNNSEDKEKDTETESDSKSKMNGADLPKDKTLPENDTNLDKPELMTDKNESVDKELTKTVSEDKEKEKDKTSMLEELMDVDFSDDF